MKLNLGENIRNYRKKIGLTQEMLADRLGVSGQSVSRWENGTTYPDIDFLPVMARMFGCTTDELLGCGEENTPPSGDELEEAMRKAMFANPVDADAAIDVMRTVRCECPDEFLRIVVPLMTLTNQTPVCENEEFMKEIRLLFREMLDNGKFPGMREPILHTWLKIVNDDEAEKMIRKYADNPFWDMSYVGLRMARAEGLADFERCTKLRSVKRLENLTAFLYDQTVMHIISRESGDPEFWRELSERKLQALHAYCGMTPDEKYPISGDGEPDIFAGTRLEIGFPYAAQLAAAGEHDLALTVLEDCCTLIEKITDIPAELMEALHQYRGEDRDCPTVMCRVPELDHLTAYRHPCFPWTHQGTVADYPHQFQIRAYSDDGLLMFTEDVRIDLEDFLLDCHTLREDFDGKWFDPIRNHPRFLALNERIRTNLGWYRGGGSAHSVRNRRAKEEA